VHDAPDQHDGPWPSQQGLRLDEWADAMLGAARASGISTDRAVGRAVLSRAQRRTLLEVDLDTLIRRRLDVDASGPRTLRFTADELAAICRALAARLTESAGSHRTRLLKAAEKVAEALTGSLVVRRPPPTSPSRPKTAFQIKVTLKRITPVVWRRFQMLDGTLSELHDVIQVVMGCGGLEAYRFDTGAGDHVGPSDGGAVKLSQLVKKRIERFEYTRGDRDDWRHVVDVESVFEPEPGVPFPECLDGARAVPPDGIGGADGYPEFLAAIHDPDHPKHDEHLDRCGGWFDPEVFDPWFVNRVLSRMSRDDSLEE